MSTDNPIKQWVDERRAIRAGGGDDMGVNSPKSVRAIVDAHNTLPAALSAIEAVLELHKPYEWSFGYGPVYSCTECSRLGGNLGKEEEAEWPCPTVQAIEGAIKSER